METTPGKRVRMFREAKGYKTASAFAEAAGLKVATLSSIETDRTSPSFDILATLANSFPDLNTDWLLTGAGPMLRDGRVLTPTERPATTAAPVTAVPQAGRGPMLTPEQAAEVLIELANAKGHIARLESAVEYQDEIIADLRADKTLLQRAYFGYTPPAGSEEPTEAGQPSGPESLPGKSTVDSYAAEVNPATGKAYVSMPHRENGVVVPASAKKPKMQTDHYALLDNGSMLALATATVMDEFPAIDDIEDDANAA